MSIREAVRGAPPYRFHEQVCEVKLDQNESPWDLSDELRSALLTRIAEIEFNRYPEIYAHSLRAALAARHQWASTGVVVAGGSNILIQALTIAAGVGQTVVTVTPTFPVYALQARLLGASLVEVPLAAGFELPLAELKRALSRGRGVLFLTNPAAPTGNLHPGEQIEELLDAASDRWTVALDEAYQQFAGSDHRALVARHPNAVSLRTMSKAFGLAGARLGYALCGPELAEQLTKVILPFSVSALQQAAAEAVLARPELLDERVGAILAERERIAVGLAAIPGVEAFASRTNFVLFRVTDAGAVYRGLIERGVLIRRQDHLPGLAGCLRVTVGERGDNDRFLDALAAVVARLGPDGRGEAEVVRG